MGRKKIVRPEAERIKSILITKTAIKELVSEDIVDRVINFQFKDFRDMVFEHDQIEISGFGKFLVSPNKVAKKMRRMENTIAKYKGKIEKEPNATQGKKEFWESNVTTATAAIEDLKTRTNGYENKH